MAAQYIFFLGNHPELSAAEAWRVLEHRRLTPQLLFATNEVMAVELGQSLSADNVRHLGGCDRVAYIIGQQDSAWTAEQAGPLLLPSPLPVEKLVLGVSSVNMPKDYGFRLARDLKKLVREQGGRLKFIEPQHGTRLNAAQVIFNDLLTPPHKEITVLAYKGSYYLAETVNVQDIQAYEKRDTARPARDAKIGMLPPKLAQMMINIAVSSSTSHANPINVLDPFCGMGTVLQEAWLMGHEALGSDESKEMIQAASRNMTWMEEQFAPDPSLKPRVILHNARQAFPPDMLGNIDAIATEPFLGKPLSAPLPPRELDQEMEGVSRLYLAAFENFKTVLKPGAAIVFLMPAWRTSRGARTFYLMPDGLLDAISSLGYIRGYVLPEALGGVWQRDNRSSVIYARPAALVGRELTLWHYGT